MAETKTPKTLDAAAILGAAKSPPQAVHVPSLGGIVHVREMNVGERDEYEMQLAGTRTDEASAKRRIVRSSLLVRALCDADGKRLFIDDQAEELAGTLGARAADRLFSVARRLNGIGADAVEELEGN